MENRDVDGLTAAGADLPSPGTLEDEFKGNEALLRELLLLSILRALTAFIPLPFVDGIAEGVLAKRIYIAVAKANCREFDKTELKALCDDGGGCLSGCRGCFIDLLLWPLRSVRLLRILIFAPFEFKKVVDRASRSFVQSCIVHHVLAAGLWPEGKASLVARVRDEVCRQVGTGPVEHLFQLALEGTGRKLQEALGLLLKAMRRMGKVKEEEKEAAVTCVLDDIKDEEERKLNPILESLVQAVRKLPASYLQELGRVTLEKLEAALHPPSPDTGAGGPV